MPYKCRQKSTFDKQRGKGLNSKNVTYLWFPCGRWTLHGIRQQQINVGSRQKECKCISDFVAPKGSGVRDIARPFNLGFRICP